MNNKCFPSNPILFNSIESKRNKISKYVAQGTTYIEKTITIRKYDEELILIHHKWLENSFKYLQAKK